MTKISIIISLYRTDQHLARFLQEAKSLSKELTSSDVSHELILVVNDATELERDLLDQLSSPFKVLHVPREPIYASWNRGVREAQGEIVTFWGVDDTRFSKAIIEGIKTLENADVTYFPFIYHRFIRVLGFPVLAKVKTFTPPVFDRDRFQKEMHLGPHFMAKKDVLNTAGYFDESYKIAGDFAWQVKAAKSGARFVPTYTISGIFRNDGATLSGSRSELHKEENAKAVT